MPMTWDMRRNRSMPNPLVGDGIRLLAAALLLFLSSGCERGPDDALAHRDTMRNSPGPLSLKENIGWIHGACLGIRNGKIEPGTSIQVLVLSDPQELANANVTGRVRESDSECPALLSDRAEINNQEGRFFYKLDFGKESPTTMAIGLVSESVRPRKRNSMVEFDLNRDGVVERAGTCLTTEGMQFYISSSATFDAKALWSDYYYLGYDNKPTCP